MAERITIRVPNSTYRELERLGDAWGMSPEEVVRALAVSAHTRAGSTTIQGCCPMNVLVPPMACVHAQLDEA